MKPGKQAVSEPLRAPDIGAARDSPRARSPTRGVILINRSGHAFSGLRVGLAGVFLAGTLLVSTGVEFTPSAGASDAPFCAAIFSFVQNEATLVAKMGTSGEDGYAKASLPYFEKIDAAAPSGKDKLVFNTVVKVYKYLAHDKSATDLEKYLKLNTKKINAATAAVATSIKACA